LARLPDHWAEFFGNRDCATAIKRAGGRPPEEIVLPKGVSEELVEDLMLTAQQVVQYQEAFNLFDEDKSGELDCSELKFVIRSIGFDVSEVEAADMVRENYYRFTSVQSFSLHIYISSPSLTTHHPLIIILPLQMYEADEDGSGALNFTEFLELMARRFGGEEAGEVNEETVQKKHDEIVACLRIFDKDQSGTLSHDEFMAAMMSLGEPLTDSQAEEITTFIDLSGGKEIDYDELAEMLARK
jgi:Ca2+-binding EF-hand superfamily protein